MRVFVCLCVRAHMCDTQVPQDDSLRAHMIQRRKWQHADFTRRTSRGGGVGVCNYKDRPSLWDTYGRRARQERSEAATVSGALQRPKPPEKLGLFGRSSRGAAERVRAGLGCVSACVQGNCRFSVGLLSSMVALPGKNAEWGGLRWGDGLGNLLRGPLATQGCHRLVPTATNKVSTDFVALQTEVTQRPPDDMIHRVIFILFLRQVYPILLKSK